MMIKIYMENRLSLFSFHLWSLLLCEPGEPGEPGQNCHLTKVTAVTYCHFLETLVTWEGKRDKFIIG